MIPTIQASTSREKLRELLRVSGYEIFKEFNNNNNNNNDNDNDNNNKGGF